MGSFKGKQILVGVTGSIAAYKAAFFVRLLVKRGADVQVILSPGASQFVTPLTFSTLSKRKALTSYTTDEGHDWNNHVELASWADLFIIAPATANTIGKMTHGICDNLLLATYLSAKCPVMVAPAMDLDMYQHPSTTANLDRLRSYGHHVLEAQYGELASGLMGDGRLPEPEELVREVENVLSTNLPLEGKRIVVTAGPTIEPIDPVRFISNHSTGKMGIALANELANQGASVTLIKGHTHLEPQDGVRVIPIQSANDLMEASQAAFAEADVFIGAAAVADYRPREMASQKIKKRQSTPKIELEENPDILKSMGALKKEGQMVIGFALETQNARENALKKLEEKNLDFIVLNSLEDEGAGFGHDTNKISIIDRNNNYTNFELKPKQAVAKDIVEYLINFSNA